MSKMIVLDERRAKVLKLCIAKTKSNRNELMKSRRNRLSNANGLTESSSSSSDHEMLVNSEFIKEVCLANDVQYDCELDALIAEALEYENQLMADYDEIDELISDDDIEHYYDNEEDDNNNDPNAIVCPLCHYNTLIFNNNDVYMHDDIDDNIGSITCTKSTCLLNSREIKINKSNYNIYNEEGLKEYLASIFDRHIEYCSAVNIISQDTPNNQQNQNNQYIRSELKFILTQEGSLRSICKKCNFDDISFHPF